MISSLVGNGELDSGDYKNISNNSLDITESSEDMINIQELEIKAFRKRINLTSKIN